ncbi:hypothetical protein RhiirC2_194993 [Rhizophagus irregularis]|uniref:Uncharacterized protein n=1 Tax=Rhizophagus irregularis TaxID=588596 RepID=A0A2N1MJZ9_9GLOM|nr:hypothetical protein RhiirC2_194993 [Rhizophagus irregularis]
MYNFRKEFDWQSTLEFISDHINFTQRQCSQKDTRDRSYRIKNLLKELPSYDTLFKRNTNKIESDICKRCNINEIENWEHIWRCEVNAVSIDEILQESIYKYETQLEERKLYDEIKILRKFNFDFIRIVEQPSVVLRGKSRIWEILRGVYNDNFNKSTNKKEEMVIKNLWNFVYEEFKQRIWIPRCDEINEIERKEGIQKTDLRKRKEKSDDELAINKEEKDKRKKIQKTDDIIEKTKKIIFKIILEM